MSGTANERLLNAAIGLQDDVERLQQQRAELVLKIARLQSLGNAVIDSCEMWSWLLENGGMLPDTEYLNMTVKLGPLWALAQALGRS